MKQEKILAVTGATGKKSGGAFVEQLAKEYEKVLDLFPGGVRILARATSDVTKVKEYLSHSEICVGELTDDIFLQEALCDVDTLVHIAGIFRSKKIVDAAISCGVRRLILVHTTGIYSKYKAAGEEYRKIEEYVYEKCKANNILLTICRPTMIYGNISDKNVVTFIKMVDKFPLMPVVNGARYELQPVHYTDLGKAYCSILLNEESTANLDFVLSGGEPIQLRNMLAVIGKYLGKNVRFISCPFWLAYFASVMLYWFTFGKCDYREKVQRLCEPRTYSYEAAAKAFGYNPVSFEIGVKEEVKEYLLNKNGSGRMYESE